MSFTFTTERQPETDDERRLREEVNRLCEKHMRALDSAMHLRVAPDQAKRLRNVVRTKLQEAALFSMEAMAVCRKPHE